MASSIDIHDAAQQGNVIAIEAYIRSGGNMYVQDKQGNPPLHVASWHGREASVAAFLDAGVDPAALNRLGQTPLYFAQKNGHEGCAMLLRGNTSPPFRSRSSSPRQQQEETGDGDRTTTLDGSKQEKKKDEDMSKDKRTKSGTSSSSSRGKKLPSRILEGEPAAAAPPSLLPPPPPPTAQAAPAPPAAPVFPKFRTQNQHLAASTTQGGGEGLEADWHLCHDYKGNAYYYSVTTGESVWAEVGDGGKCVAESATAAGDENHWGPEELASVQGRQGQQQQLPDGWSLHEDPTTGHTYYLHDATHESVWAKADGSFPRVNCNAAAERAGGEEHDGGGDDACAEWDTGIVLGVGAAGARPTPTAPPPLSNTLELAEHGAEVPNEGKKTVDGGEDMSMLLCTQGVMSTNNFFAAQQLEILPSSSGGSPMASAPPAAESGGRRSSNSPLRSDTTAPTAGDDSESESTLDGCSPHQGGDHETYDSSSNFTSRHISTKNNDPSNNLDHHQLRTESFASSPLAHRDSGGSDSPPPAVVVGVWDTATEAFASSNNGIGVAGNTTGVICTTLRPPPSQSRSQPAQKEVVAVVTTQTKAAARNGETETPYDDTNKPKHETLLESSTTAAGGGSSGFYPKVVDRDGFSR
ncbi:unnamed protein product [Ectocarpus sp. 12 AP-2014]